MVLIWLTFALSYDNSEMYLCTRIYFLYKNKNIVSKRDSFVKCSIELFQTFVHILHLIKPFMFIITWYIWKHEK